MTLPRDLDLTTVTDVYIQARINDLYGQAGNIRERIWDLEKQREGKLKEAELFEQELVRRRQSKGK